MPTNRAENTPNRISHFALGRGGIAYRYWNFRGTKDLTEWIGHGGTRAILLDLIRNTPRMETRSPSRHAGGFSLTPLGDLLARPDVPLEYVAGESSCCGHRILRSIETKGREESHSPETCALVSPVAKTFSA